MKKVHGIGYVMDALELLANNEYSLLWELTEDFEFNGHKISVKDSNQFKSVIIDGRYEYIGNDRTIVSQYGVTYRSGLLYVRDLLTNSLDKAKKESTDFGNGSISEIREAIAEKVSLKEDKAIKIFNRGSDEYNKLEAAAQLLETFTGKEYYVGDTYFDLGQDWKWTTVLQTSEQWGGVQILTPKAQEDIITASNAEQLGKAVDSVIRH
jgi:hypothetical protein